MNESQRLRYEITDWSQVTDCLSNNSRDLKLRYIEISDEDLVGKLIMVEHNVYGTMFSCLVECRGPILSTLSPMDDLYHVLPMDEILAELRKFGFEIFFKREKKLTGDQLSYLMNLDQLGFEKIRKLTIVLPYIPHQPKYRTIVVGFMACSHPKWLDNTYQCPQTEYQKAVDAGTVVNLTAISQSRNFDWSFLGDFVLSINDILAVNSI